MTSDVHTSRVLISISVSFCRLLYTQQVSMVFLNIYDVGQGASVRGVNQAFGAFGAWRLSRRLGATKPITASMETSNIAESTSQALDFSPATASPMDPTFLQQMRARRMISELRMLY